VARLSAAEADGPSIRGEVLRRGDAASAARQFGVSVAGPTALTLWLGRRDSSGVGGETVQFGAVCSGSGPIAQRYACPLILLWLIDNKDSARSTAPMSLSSPRPGS